MPLVRKYDLEHIGRAQDRWRDVFDTIDSNFDKIDEFLAEISTRIHVTHIVADDEQTDFTLDNVYMTDANNLAVYKNGVRQYHKKDYDELEPNTFRMYEPCEFGDRIVAIYNEFYLPEDTSSLEVEIFNVLTSLKKSVYGDEYDTLDEAIEASLEHARDSVTDLDDKLIAEVQEKAAELQPLQERLDGIIETLTTGQFFDGVRMIWFEPHVSEDGWLSWTNNGGLENPDPVKLNVDVEIPRGTVAIGSGKGGYTYTDAGQFGALIRTRPKVADSNPVPHFATVPLEYGGLGDTTSIRLIDDYSGPLQYDSTTQTFKPIEGTGVLIRDEDGIRFGRVPVKYGGTGTTGQVAGSIDDRDAVAYVSAFSDTSLERMSWSEVSEVSRLAAENPEAYRGWIGKSKTIRLGDRESLPDSIDGMDITTGREYDYDAEVTATIVGIKASSMGDGDSSGFVFSVNPLLGVYTDDDVSSDSNVTDETLEPDSRKRTLLAYRELLPDDLREVVRPVTFVEHNPMTGEAEGHRYDLFVPSLSEVNLLGAIDEREYTIDEPDGCFEYYSTPRDMFFDKTVMGDDTEPLGDGERYVLRSTAVSDDSYLLATERFHEFVDSLEDDRLYFEPDDVMILSSLVKETEGLIKDDRLDAKGLNDRINDLKYFRESMIPVLDDISWDDFFDLVYELSVKSPTIADEGDNQLGRLIGKSKSIDTRSYGNVRLEVIAVGHDGEGTVTFVPEGQVLYKSRMRDDESDSGGYNLADVMKGSLESLREEISDDFARYMYPIDRTYTTPEGYESWVTTDMTIPSVNDLNSYDYFVSHKRVMHLDGEPIGYWTRDI